MRGFVQYVSHALLLYHTTYVYIVQFGSIIVTYCTNPLIPERSCTRIPSNLRGNLREFYFYIFRAVGLLSAKKTQKNSGFPVLRT